MAHSAKVIQPLLDPAASVGSRRKRRDEALRGHRWPSLGSLPSSPVSASQASQSSVSLALAGAARAARRGSLGANGATAPVGIAQLARIDETPSSAAAAASSSAPSASRRTLSLYETGVCRTLGPPLFGLLIFLALIAAGVSPGTRDLPVRRRRQRRPRPSGTILASTSLLGALVDRAQILGLLPNQDLPFDDPDTHERPDWALPAAIAALVTGVLGPAIVLRFCVWWLRPGRRDRQRDAFYGDAMLQEMTTGNSITEHFDSYGDDNGENGTLVLLAGAGAHRGTLRPLARRLAHEYRVLVVDLPGHGSLAAVPFSLLRCERILNLIIDREVTGLFRRVALAAYGASAYVAAFVAEREARRVAALLLLGACPDYVGMGVCWGWESLYRLHWAAFCANRALRHRVALSELPEPDRQDNLVSDFHPGVIPDMIDELRGRSLLQDLRDFPRPVHFFGPQAWMTVVQDLVPVSHVRVQRVPGLRDEKIPPQEEDHLNDLSEALLDFLSELHNDDWKLSTGEVSSIRTWSRASVAL